MKRRIIAGILFAFVFIAVLFLTLQGPKDTFFLSETFRDWASRLGYKGGPLQFRSDVHLIEYFIVGVSASLFGLTLRWQMWKPGLLGCGLGLIDEVLKILLPTREFGPVDLCKDCLGVWLAVFFVYEVANLRRGK